MRLLSFESSSVSASVAVTDGEILLGQSFQNVGLTHSRTLLPMAEALLANTGLSLSQIDAFAVSAGPGSFTGVRIGIATVKGLAAAAGRPCAGVSSLEAAAFGLDTARDICAVMDARAGQVYNALFRWEGQCLTRLCPDRAISMEDLEKELLDSEKEYILVGDGAKLCYNSLNKAADQLSLAPPHLRYPQAYGVARAADRVPFGDADALAPFYLRLPQAERQRLGKLLPSEKNA